MLLASTKILKLDLCRNPSIILTPFKHVPARLIIFIWIHTNRDKNDQKATAPMINKSTSAEVYYIIYETPNRRLVAHTAETYFPLSQKILEKKLF
jgi:hypothetical protein